MRVTIKKTIEVEPCTRCKGYIDGDMHRVAVQVFNVETREVIDELYAGDTCGKCLAIIKNSTTKRTRNPKPTTPKDGA